MKIGIDFSFLSNGSQSIRRGVGRYTQQQIREVTYLDHENEYCIFVPPSSNLDFILPEIRLAKNVQIKPFQFDQYSDAVIDDKQLIEYSSLYQDFIYSENIDLFHFTLPYLDSLPIQFDVCPMVANYFDAIPLIFPSIYLTNEIIKKKYLYNTYLCKRANRLIAISKSAKMDARLFLGYPSDRIDISYPIPDPHFQILSEENLSIRLKSLRERINLPENYFLNITGFHYTKNHSTLLRAYRNLPPSIRNDIGLVFVCEINSELQKNLQKELTDLGINQNVILTGFVSDEDLVTLYNSATALVHPSIYEGFGLPVVEGMRCGSPIITTTTSSLPEVGGNAALFVDPYDIDGFTEAMKKVYSDESFRKEMIRKGLAHSQMFSSLQLGQSTLACYQKAVENNSEKINKNIKIAMWSPLPPLETGVATYCSDILDELGERAELELFIDEGYMPDLNLLEKFRINNFKSFERRNKQVKFDIIIYEAGASEFHYYMLKGISDFPGILDLHDLTFASFYLAKINNIQNKGLELIAEIEGNHIYKEYKKYLRKNKRGNVLNFSQNYMMIKSIVDESKAVIVHYPLAEKNISVKIPETKIYTTLLSVTDPWIENPPCQMNFRKIQLGYSKKDFIIGVFGIIDKMKRNEITIKAFAKIVAKNPFAKLLIVGRAFSPHYQEMLNTLVKKYRIEKSVKFTGYVSDDIYKRYMSICNLSVNLRDPSRKQMSLSLIQALSNGIPSIITDLPEWDFLPSTCCIRVKPDKQEINMIYNSVTEFILQPDYCMEMGHQAREYYLNYCTNKKMAFRYLEIINVLTQGDKIE